MTPNRREPTSRPSKQPSRGRANLARLQLVNETEIARTAPAELRGLPKDFWDDAKPVDLQRIAGRLRQARSTHDEKSP